MILWVKEFENILTTNTILMLVKDSIPVKPFVTADFVQQDDLVIISQHDTVSELTALPFTFLVYETALEKISNNIIQEYYYNHDYYYLNIALAEAKNPRIHSIISGSSYGLFGIDENLLSQEVNLSLPSQDLFYSLKGIYEVCNANSNIKNIVLCCNYYYFYTDLSKTQNQKELLRISKVYEPLYHDIHNCLFLPPKADLLFHSNIFHLQNIVDAYSISEYQKHYFHSGRPRKMKATKEWSDKSKDWTQLNESERQDAGLRRAASHNKAQKYNLTLAENTSYFNELTLFCVERNINLLVVVTPASQYYRSNLYSGYKNSFYDVLANAPGIVHLLDLFEDENYLTEDFNDPDHLSDSGALKMTSAILNMLQEINHI